MKAREIRGLSEEQLAEELLKLKREQFNLRMQQATGRLARPHEHGRVRKDIARLKTVLNELRRQGKNQ